MTERVPLVVEKQVIESKVEVKPAEAKKPIMQTPAVIVKSSNRYPEIQFFSSGSTLLNLAMGGGWACKRVFNLVGDRSSGKSLLAFEAFANHARTFKDSEMRYVETEARFNPIFASSLGFPDSVNRPEIPLDTIEDFQDDLNDFLKNLKGTGLYVLDSLDALTDDTEYEKYSKPAKEGDRGSYGTGKAKKMSQLFRLVARDIEKKNCTLGIISQLRDNIGVSWGETQVRSGGRALDYFASQCIWLKELGKLTKTSLGEERAVGVEVHAKCKKCSVAMPFREAIFTIQFGYGVEDNISMLNWLKNHSEKETFEDQKKQLEAATKKQDYPKLDELHEQFKADVIRVWNQVEANVAPKIKKYR